MQFGSYILRRLIIMLGCTGHMIVIIQMGILIRCARRTHYLPRHTGNKGKYLSD